MNSLRNKLLLFSCLLMSGFVCGMNPQESDITQQEVAPGCYGHEECPICGDNYREFVQEKHPILFTCGHWVCSACSIVSYCPMCRTLGLPIMDKDKALYQAILESNVRMVRALLAAGANANALTTNRENQRLCEAALLHEAARQGKGEVVKILIEFGADINGRNWYGRTPLDQAACRGSIEVISVLLEKGANINLCSRKGETPLYSAVKSGYVNAVLALLEAGADVHAVTLDGSTMLHCAMSYGKTETVPILLAYGVDVNRADRSGRTPLDLARAYYKTEIIKMLRDEGAKNKCVIQ